jgi:hypothetical protein
VGVTVGEGVKLGVMETGAPMFKLIGKVQLVTKNRLNKATKMRFFISGLYWYLTRVSSKVFPFQAHFFDKDA